MLAAMRQGGIDREFRSEELLARLYDATAEADVDALRALIADDFEFALESTSPEATAYVGADGFVQAVCEWRAAWDSYRAVPVRFREVGDLIVAVVEINGRGRMSGLAFSEQRTDVWQRCNGRVRRLDRFKATEDALAHVGVVTAAAGWQESS
jgi:ketosteroid isomerase-like protein